MESSPYLQAIQNVSGSTPGEKYKTLNRIAREIIPVSHGQSDTIQVQSSLECPEILMPFVKLENARILQKPDEIVDALKSNDTLIFNRALRTKWFFDGSIASITNIHYFRNNIFNCISLKNRFKLIKTLSIHLTANKKDGIAEEFYVTLSSLYGVKVSERLLLACSESFIWGAIVTRQLVLSVKIVRQLYLKYPDVIIKYLQLSKPNDEPYERNLHVIPIYDYNEFLPRLLKKHVNIYIELIEAHTQLGKNLGRKGSDVFLKNGTDALIQNPCKFAQLLNLKSITSKLTKDQFKLFIRNLFPPKISQYSPYFFIEMYEYLEYYPSDEKVSFILSTFKEVYNESYLDHDELIDSQTLILLSPDDRAAVAKKKLDKTPQWHIKDSWDLESSWRCYLPISESIAIIKDKISKTPEAEYRCELLKQLIYSCKVNNDEDALLKVLKYIETRHKNERGDLMLKIIKRLLDDFRLENLSMQHWEILDNIRQILHIKNELLTNRYIAIRFIIAKIHFNFVNNLSITEIIKFLFNIKINDLYYHTEWNILQDCPEYERKCLEEFINIAPLLYPKDKSKILLIITFLNGINKFNERISYTKNKIQSMAVENYSWLSAEISQLANSNDDDSVTLRENLKKHNPNLYDAWVKEKENDKLIILFSDKECNEWIKNPDKISIQWEKYLDECKMSIYNKCAQRFIKRCRWHQNLPIKFAEKCLKDITEKHCPDALIVLALLYEGSEFERIINPYLPTNLSIDVNCEAAKENYSIIELIPMALSIVNPPVSLNVTLQFCKKNTIHMAANWLKVLALQTPVDKLIPFTIKLMDQPVSISKHFIRIFTTAANINELHSVLINLWKTEKNNTIRTLVFDKIYQLFVSYPSNQTWLLLNECIDGLTADDQGRLLSICSLQRISNEYIVDYVRKLFNTLREFKRIDDIINPESIWSHIAGLLRLPVNIAVLFPEEFHQEILTTYFCDMALPTDVSMAAQYYLINAYINPSMEKLQSRLNFYSKLFIDILKNQWNISDPLKPNVYPANYMIDKMMIKILSYIKDNNIREKFIDVTLKSFLLVLNPVEAPVFYSYYTFASLYRGDEMSRDNYVNNIGKIIPSLIETYSAEFIPNLGKILSRCLKLLWNDYNSQDEVTLDIIEGLLKLNIEHAITLAAAIPVDICIEENNERYLNILYTFRKQKNPAVIAHASMQINCHGFKRNY